MMQRVVVCMMAVIGGGAMLAQAGENWNEAQVRPTATIPVVGRVPTIDGVIDADEWQGLGVSRFVAQRPGRDLLQPRDGAFWIASDGQSLFVAVRSAVHPTAGAMTALEPLGQRNVPDLVQDDSIELWIDNKPLVHGGQYFQIMINSLGALYTVMTDRDDGSVNTWWFPEGFEQAHQVEDGIWTAEFAIPLAALGIEDASQTIGVRVCRNYKYPWDQSRWAAGVHTFDSVETMSRIRFVAQAPTVRETGFQDEDGIAVGVAVGNPTGAPLPVRVRLGYNPEQQPRYYEAWDDVDLAPGEQRHLVYRRDFFSPENYPAIAEILVTSPDGETVYYHRDVKWHTQPAHVWDRVAVASKEEAFELQLEWHPTPKLLRWRVDYAAYTERETVTGLRLVVRDQETGAAVAEVEAAAPASGVIERRSELADLPDGRFDLELYAMTREGEVGEPVKTLVFEHASDFPWLNNEIGISDVIIPPFTPLTVDGREVGAILRTHTLTDAGLWGQVKADGREILADPMRFEVRQGGRLQSVSGKQQFLETVPHRVVSEAEWQAGSVRGVTRGEMDYDGAMKVTLELGQAGDDPIESLDLVIPLTDRHMPLMHAAADGLRINYAGAVPEGGGQVWNSIRASRAHLVGTFLPYLWVGAEGPGLTWFAANDKGWEIDLDDQTPALALERDGDVLNLRIRLIQKPVVLNESRTITFGLMATPAKPMPENWRRIGLFHGGADQNLTFLGMCQYWGGLLYGVFPMERDFTVVRKIAESAKEGVNHADFFREYIERYPQVAREVHWSANLRNADLVIPYTNVRGANTFIREWRVYQDEWRRINFGWRQTATDQTSGQIDFTVIPLPSKIDFLLYYYREFIRHGMDGIYWDNICIYANMNRVTSEGFYRQDGLFQPEADIWRLRELTRRTAVLTHQHGRPNVNMPHMTNAALVPVFSWTGFYLGWEWKYGDTDFQERFSRAYIRAINIGRQDGNIPGVLDGHTHHIRDPEHRAWVIRTRAGVVLTHELKIQRPDSLVFRVNQDLFSMGYGTDACRTYNYWEDDPVATVTGIDSSWIVHESDDRVVIVGTDWHQGGEPVIELDLEQLGLEADFEAVNWENRDDVFVAEGNRLVLPALRKNDFMILEISK